MENGAAAGQTWIRTRQQVDPDTLLEGIIGPYPLHDDHSFLHPVKGPRVDDDAAPSVPEAHPVAVAEAEPVQHIRMHEGSRAPLARNARRRVVEGRVEERGRRSRNEAIRLRGIAVERVIIDSSPL